MELKKSPKADLQGMKGLFTLVGLAVSLAATIGIFSWSKQEVVFEDMGVVEEEIVMEEAIVTHQEEPKQAPPKQAPAISDVIKIIDNKIKVDTDASVFDADFDEDTVIEIQTFEDEGEVDIVEEETPIIKAEVMPKFQGGDYNSTFRKWLAGEIKYPTVASENNITGRVIVQGVVERDGTLTNLKVLANPDQSLTDEALRAIKLSPKWEPGMQRGKAVRVFVIIPVLFNL